MKGYKAFNKGLICRDKQYAENTVFEEESAEICKIGMHFCKNPLDTLDYYPLIDNKGNITEFAEVEALDNAKTNDNKKFCTKKLKIGAKLNLSQFIKASVDVTYQNIKSEVDKKLLKATAGGDNATLAGGDYAKLAGGDYAKLAGGYYATLAGGYNAKLAGGNYAKLAGGYNAKLAGGDYATLAGGDYATLAGGDNATLAGGYNATLAGGYYATLAGGNYATLAGGNCATLAGGDCAKLAGGNYATLAGGENSVIVGDNHSIAKGKKGAVIVLIERDNNCNIIDFKAIQVDGEKIKEDVLYKLKNGEFVEVGVK
jgi:hypothetical protein